mmetsp:Transcript_16432/g.31913  ORF Transcript_16432/g.31913 Transcript_16432/m.31913 type:complete len:106 (-) Transcript_16432:187-504(-)|eukprot:CAMPEP_0171493942 /NCGR_PEP_ID=MMETSP0958-20121227/5239_1 /TAXON_ID=87120 /ORGANISM="Aurantiochytrium limacinum, Strain ATCCMYA-1381" /LENGTH=105 /DNA_ID=CAMNT_0012027615 /DNA_START=950 /DNA_END=1267 /DNA_ORIENTATION=+
MNQPDAMNGAQGQVRLSPISKTLYHLTYELFEVIEQATATRADVVKGIWNYIKAKKLQNPDNRREIICDVKLRQLFGKDKVGMFEMNKLVQRHILSRVVEVEEHM